jgi:hypothetical protein
MNKRRFIWGILLLALAALLAVLNLIFQDKLMFIYGGIDLSYLPPAVLAIAGITLLIIARQKIRGY